MRNKIGYGDSQKQLYLSYSGDGVADLIVGGAFMAIGLMLLSDMPFVPVWLIIFLMPISWGLKRAITVPRLSETEMAAEQKEEGPAVQKNIWLALLGIFLLTAAVLLTTMSPRWGSAFFKPYLSWGMIGLTLISVLVILSLIYRAWRWAFYGLLVIPVMAISVGIGAELPVALGGLGAAIFFGGVLIGARFVATHPRLDI